MTKSKKYFDANSREMEFEKGQHTFNNIQSAWKQILTEGTKKGDAKTVAAQLMKKQGITKMEEEDVKPVDDKPAEDPAAVPVDAPTDVPAGEVPPGLDPAAAEPAPAPISTDAPEGDVAAPAEVSLATNDFVQKTLSGLPGDVSKEADPTGIFKATVNDPQSGAFMIVVYPLSAFTSIHEVADIIEPPKDQAGAPTDVPPTDAAAPVPTDVPPTDVHPGAGEVPPTAAPTDTPVSDPAAPAPETTPAPVEEPKEDEEIKEEDEKCEDKKEDEEDEKKIEESRDPTVVGKKDWKLFFESRYKK